MADPFEVPDDRHARFLLNAGDEALSSARHDHIDAVRHMAQHMADGRPVGEPLTGHTGHVTAVAVGALPDGTPVIVSGGHDGTVRVWRLADGTLVGQAQGAWVPNTGINASGPAFTPATQRILQHFSVYPVQVNPLQTPAPTRA